MRNLLPPVAVNIFWSYLRAHLFHAAAIYDTGESQADLCRFNSIDCPVFGIWLKEPAVKMQCGLPENREQ